MARLDPHSYADDGQPSTELVELALRFDFATRTAQGEVTLHLAEAKAGPLDLDTRDLRIESVTDLQGRPLAHELRPPEPILGARLRTQLPQGARGVRVRYATSPEAKALQWLSPEQTAGGTHPFLYSQCQPIHARSIAPLQDTPRIRVRAKARFTVPPQLRALMAAAPLGREILGSGEAVDSFEMQQPVPPYLLAFAVGDLSPRQLSRRSAVWAERPLADAAAWEFDGVEAMMQAAEDLFGPYEWDRFDVLVLPRSFPYGGMENPRLAFVTPSILAGDRSLVHVIAHELAHAWTGNLVTAASANEFWLNEGFTVYAERRILEAIEGREMAELHAAAGRQELTMALQRFASRPQLTRLRTDLRRVDPDEAHSPVPYEKGYLFLRKLEELCGRPAWDDFLRAYVGKFRFRSVVTQDFLEVLEATFPGLADRAQARLWIDEPGLPADAPPPKSRRLPLLQDMARRVGQGELPSAQVAERLTPAELLVLLQALPAPLSAEACAGLDRLFGLSPRKSIELRHAFVLAQLRSGLPEGREGARRILRETGRMKYLRPLYTELCRRPETRALAAEIFAETKATYHPIARAVVESVLREAKA